MPRKNYTKSRKLCRVTFDLPPEVNAKRVSLCGEFNKWNPREHPMKKRKDGRWSVTVSLKAGEDYQFKYLLDKKHWENDWNADGYVFNSVGSENSLIKV
jgi:1,4-alpha-glucan branching enzyme